jgi:RNA polymerase sigma-70 factor (ECF subfamily)
MTAPESNPANQAEESAGSVSSSLLQRLQSQETVAWQRLTYLYGPTVYSWCRQKGLSPEDADDVRQEVFQAVVKGIGAFRRDRPGDSFRGWLWTITHNKLCNFRRHGARHDPVAAAGGTTALEHLREIPQDESVTPDPTQAAADQRGLYQRALELIQSEFAERTWQAFWRVAVEGRPAVEVAAELGMSPGAVYIAKSRVRRRLQEEFADLV